jgi:hypothetical protein
LNIKVRTLMLNCRRSRELIDLSSQISYFHGPISAGKSSIARLIDFCLGGDLERTPAIQQELVSVKLSAQIGDYDVLLEREADNSNQLQVNWKDSAGFSQRILAPVRSSKDPIWEDRIFNISDLIFHLLGVQPIKVRLSERDPDSQLVSLSFRDIMWYCYLEQGRLDSSFYNLESPILKQKSRYAIRFILGAFSEKLSQLETRFSEIKDMRSRKSEESKQIRSFLEQFGYSSDSVLIGDIEQAKRSLQADTANIKRIQEGYTQETHFADRLRDQLRKLSEQVSVEEQVLIDLTKRIGEQESLKAEILTARTKLARSESARKVLAGLSFENCPACGARVTRKQLPDERCSLCKEHLAGLDEQSLIQEDAVRHDLDSRMQELDEVLEEHTKARAIQERKLAGVKREKEALDRELDDELKRYDSRFLAASREIERRIAATEEKVRNLEDTLEMPVALSKLEQEIDGFAAQEEALKRSIFNEKQALEASKNYVSELEENFLQSLVASKVPGVSETDTVRINPVTWVPDILVSGNKAMKWNFDNAGSGGKKTLLNVCYALAVHRVARSHNLPLPSFLVIDTPMKNIGEDVNRDIFEAFYTHLYALAEGPLSNTQFIIIDKEYFPPKSRDLSIKARLMTQDPEHPPLIPYYQGA